MERIDRLVLERLVEKVLTPERVTLMLRDRLKHLAESQTETEKTLQTLAKALKAKEDGLTNLYEAIEKGVISLDSTLQTRINNLKDEREAVLAEMALIKRDRPSPRKVSQKQVGYALQRMKEMLLDTNAGYGKQLLQPLVESIRVDVRTVTLRGSHAAMEQAVSEMKLGTVITVPSFVQDWRARRDSNS